MLRQAPSPPVYPSWLCCIPPNLLKFKNKGRRSAAALPPVRHVRVGEGTEECSQRPSAVWTWGDACVSMGGRPVWAWGGGHSCGHVPRDTGDLSQGTGLTWSAYTSESCCESLRSSWMGDKQLRLLSLGEWAISQEFGVRSSRTPQGCLSTIGLEYFCCGKPCYLRQVCRARVLVCLRNRIPYWNPTSTKT